MLTRPILETFAAMDTPRIVAILRETSTLDTAAGDAALGYLAGSHPEQYAAVMAALDRAEV